MILKILLILGAMLGVTFLVSLVAALVLINFDPGNQMDSYEDFEK